MAIYECRFGDDQTERAHTVDGSDEDARMRGLVAAGSGGWAVLTPDEPVQEEPSRPADSARKDEWIAYAVHRGAVRDEAAELTKSDLIELYGG